MHWDCTADGHGYIFQVNDLLLRVYFYAKTLIAVEFCLLKLVTTISRISVNAFPLV